MRKIVAFAMLALLIAPASAASMSFLDGPYEFLDKVVMSYYKPLIWWVVIAWSQNLACSILTDEVLNLFVTEDTLTDDEKTDLCLDGVKMYWEQFFYGGAIGNQPYDLSWAWSPS